MLRLHMEAQAEAERQRLLELVAMLSPFHLCVRGTNLLLYGRCRGQYAGVVKRMAMRRRDMLQVLHVTSRGSAYRE